jgi:hypothetical protein
MSHPNTQLEATSQLKAKLTAIACRQAIEKRSYLNSDESVLLMIWSNSMAGGTIADHIYTLLY